jgi:hypothetical protein
MNVELLSCRLDLSNQEANLQTFKILVVKTQIESNRMWLQKALLQRKWRIFYYRCGMLQCGIDDWG